MKRQKWLRRNIGGDTCSLPGFTVPMSTHKLAQKAPSRKPRDGPNIPADRTVPAKDELI